MVDKLENKYNENFIFLYNNLNIDDSIIEMNMVRELYNCISNLNNKYDTLNVIINSSGGNLAAGRRIIELLRYYFKNINFIVLDRCSSTATFMALSGDRLLLSPYSVITPTEPQMDTYTNNNTSISTSVVRNYLENIDKYKDNVLKLDSLTFANYFSVINYFKELCKIYDKDKYNFIVNYMLNKVNSHQMPISIDDLLSMNIDVSILDSKLFKELEFIHNKIIDYFDKDKLLNKKLTIIMSDNLNSVYMKIYDKDKKKIFDGYKKIKEEDIMNNQVKNIRVLDVEMDILRDQKKNNHMRNYADAYTDNSYSEGSYVENPSIYVEEDNGSVYVDGYVDTSLATMLERERQERLNKMGNFNDNKLYDDNYKDGFNHWDSYNDSYYHDNYHDTYDDYGDNSYYHDEYRDAFNANKVKVKKINKLPKVEG